MLLKLNIIFEIKVKTMKKIVIYKLILVSLSVIVPQLLSAQSTDNDFSTYAQRVNRFSSIFEPWNSFRGKLTLKETEMAFTPKNAKNKGAFTLEYKDIISVKKRCLLIFPNSIVITDKNYAKYKIGTYKRREIVEKIKSKI